MAIVIFYEKPGCIRNTMQKSLLAVVGHTVQAHNLLTEPWTPERLRSFFGDLPVAQWFNLSAPQIKSGEVCPQDLTSDEALNLMIAEPLLIRRPLLEVNHERRVGFETAIIEDWIGLNSGLTATADLESCPKKLDAKPCPIVEKSR
jgi:nitrogenase-associated protein